jgi:hypothetical protein
VSTGTNLQRSLVLFARRRVRDIRSDSPDRDDFCNMCDSCGDEDSTSSRPDASSQDECNEVYQTKNQTPSLVCRMWRILMTVAISMQRYT